MTLLNSTQRGNSFSSPVKHIQNRAAYTMKELRVLHWCSLINKMQTEINCRTLMLGTILKSLKIINILITRIMFAKEKILSRLCRGWLLDELRAKRKKKPFKVQSMILSIFNFLWLKQTVDEAFPTTQRHTNPAFTPRERYVMKKQRKATQHSKKAIQK